MNGRPIFINSLQTHSAEVISWPWKNDLCHQFAPAFSHQPPETWKAAGLAERAGKKRSCDTAVRNRQHLKIYNTSDRKLGHWFVVAGANCSAEDSCSGRRGNAAANLGSGESWRSSRAPLVASAELPAARFLLSLYSAGHWIKLCLTGGKGGQTKPA